MGRLAPVAVDLETAGFEPDASITVVGLAGDAAAWQGLNAGGRPVDETDVREVLHAGADRAVELDVTADEAGLLEALRDVVETRLDGSRQYLCAFNGETWRGGFDLPFLRTACARHGADWPFADLAYADVRAMVERFNTGEAGDLDGVYDALVGRPVDDPFADSREAVTAYEDGDWAPLLRHNLADVTRTYELAVLAGRYVPKADFRMKNLGPPDG